MNRLLHPCTRLVALILSTFACSDGNNGQVTYPKPEGPAVGRWRTFEPYSTSALAFYSGALIAGDDYISWGGIGAFSDCANDGCRSGRIFNLKTEVWRGDDPEQRAFRKVFA